MNNSNTATEVGRIVKSGLEVIVTALSTYGGKNLVDIRTYADFNGQGHSPTKKGISCPIGKIDELIEGLERARLEAVKLGWLTHDREV